MQQRSGPPLLLAVGEVAASIAFAMPRPRPARTTPIERGVTTSSSCSNCLVPMSLGHRLAVELPQVERRPALAVLLEPLAVVLELLRHVPVVLGERRLDQLVPHPQLESPRRRCAAGSRPRAAALLHRLRRVEVDAPSG